MITGLFLVLIGIVILLYPQILQLFFAGFFMLIGFGMMAAAWQFRRFHKQSSSRFVNWIVRY